ncbi:hypothetical protein M5689_004825 [Euphorbia peplus]|nr:hypothetical protein M5689_004825 [Euphorbia peplus]
MSYKTYVLNIVLLSSVVSVLSLTCETTRCKTGVCNNSGTCICILPDQSTVLDGDRSFMGGKFCDEEMIMCDGSDSFWCENGGKCLEIVQGEKYKCECEKGFGGDHCEIKGQKCGDVYCFNGGGCFGEQEDGVCDCPQNWKGSSDCSIQTIPSSDFSGNMTVTKLHPHPEKGSNFSTWIVVVLAISCSAGAVAGCAFYAEKIPTRKNTTAGKFQHHSVLDSDEDEADALVHNDHSNL